MEEDIKKKILEKHYQKSNMGDYLNDNTMKYVLDAMEEYARCVCKSKDTTKRTTK